MIGAKTIVAVPVAASAVGISFATGVLDPERLADLEPAAALLVGLFASLGAALIARVFRLHAGSSGYLRLARGDNLSRFESVVFGVGSLRMVAGATVEGAPADLPPLANRGAFLVAFACLGLAAFTNPAAELLTTLPDRLASSGSRVCPDRDAVEAPKPVVRKADQRGCALIRRAFELGYADSLGSCGEVTVETAAKFHQPVWVDKPYRAEGEVASHDDDKIVTSGRIVDPGGVVCVESTSTFQAIGSATAVVWAGAELTDEHRRLFGDR